MKLRRLGALTTELLNCLSNHLWHRQSSRSYWYSSLVGVVGTIPDAWLLVAQRHFGSSLGEGRSKRLDGSGWEWNNPNGRHVSTDRLVALVMAHHELRSMPGFPLFVARLRPYLSSKGGRYRPLSTSRERLGLFVLHHHKCTRGHDTGDQNTRPERHRPSPIRPGRRETNLRPYDALHDKLEAQGIVGDLQQAGHSGRPGLGLKNG